MGTEKSESKQLKGSCRGVAANLLNSDIEVNKFDLKSSCCIHF